MNSTFFEAFLAISALGPQAIDECKSWFCKFVLQPYVRIYVPTEEIGGIENTDKRFMWLKKTLRDFKESFEPYFPPEWLLPICICLEFCRITREHLEQILENQFSHMDIAVFVKVYNKVQDFEEDLFKKFTYEQNNAANYELSNYQVESKDGKVEIKVGSAEEIKEKYSKDLKIVFFFSQLHILIGNY